MNEEEKKEIGRRVIGRAKASLYFIEDFLRDNNYKDGAYFRAILILLSYSFELILKSSLILNGQYKSRLDLETKLKRVNHDILQIAQKLGQQELEQLGIEDISPRENSSFLGYLVKTTNGEVFSIENFTDVRYDFMKDDLRDLEEDIKVKECLKFLIGMSGVINKIVW
jgi:hypothetical protein